MPHPRYHAEAHASTVQSLKGRLEAVEASSATSGFRDRVVKVWGAVRDASSTMLPPKVRVSTLTYRCTMPTGDVSRGLSSRPNGGVSGGVLVILDPLTGADWLLWVTVAWLAAGRSRLILSRPLGAVFPFARS